MISEQIRAHIYRILMAGGAVATFYGLLEGEELAVWLGLAAVVLNILPAANTSTKKHE
jgi:hypothetical protein